MSTHGPPSPWPPGYVGNFVTQITSDRGPAQIKHGAAVIAIGADVYEPTEYLYGENDHVLTQLDLEEKIGQCDEDLLKARTLVMIQCVGCRNEEPELLFPHLLRQLRQKRPENSSEHNPDMDIYILFRGHADLWVQ